MLGGDTRHHTRLGRTRGKGQPRMAPGEPPHAQREALHPAFEKCHRTAAGPLCASSARGVALPLRYALPGNNKGSDCQHMDACPVELHKALAWRESSLARTADSIAGAWMTRAPSTLYVWTGCAACAGSRAAGAHRQTWKSIDSSLPVQAHRPRKSQTCRISANLNRNTNKLKVTNDIPWMLRL